MVRVLQWLQLLIYISRKVSSRNFGAIPSTPAPSVADEPAGPSVKTAVPGPASNEVKAKMNELQVCGEASTRVLLTDKRILARTTFSATLRNQLATTWLMQVLLVAGCFVIG